MRTLVWTCVFALLSSASAIASDGQNGDEPKAWIGVRLPPVPEALAAHLQRDGLMITNVVKGSPADNAGLERYDVLVSFDGRDVTEMDDLLNAISAVGAGKPGKVTVISHGIQKVLTITPANTPDMDGIEFKYSEPMNPVIDNSQSFRGHTLRLAPDGKTWQLDDLGALRALPDSIRKLLESSPKWPGAFDLQLPANPDWSVTPIVPNDDSVRMELNLEQAENGSTVKVHRYPDGHFDVEHVDPDGKSVTTSFEDAEARAGDAEAYRLYARFGRPGGLSYHDFKIDLGDRAEQRSSFHDQIEEHMRAGRRSDDSMNATAPNDRKQITRSQVQTRSQVDGQGATTTSESLTVVIDDNGHVHVTSVHNGNRAEFDFAGKDEFKARQPELYRKFEKMTE